MTTVPPISAPKTKPKLLNSPTTAFPFCREALGSNSGSTPDIAGHHRALSIPKSPPMRQSNGTLAKPAINERALVPAKRLPITSLPPTMRFLLKRSPITPPSSMKRIIGAMRAVITRLKSVPVAPFKLRTPYARAIGDSPFPTLEMNRERMSGRKP